MPVLAPVMRSTRSSGMAGFLSTNKVRLVAEDRGTQAVFPTVPAKRGHYESWYVRLVDPSEARGVWIRYTVHKRPNAQARASLWFTLFDHGAGAPRASKV